MRAKLLSLVLACLFVVGLAAPVAAQSADTPPTFCDGLDQADCAILENSTAAMQEVTSYALDGAFDLSVSGFPDMPMDKVALGVKLQTAMAMDEAAHAAALRLNELARSTQPDGAQLTTEFPQVIKDFYSGIALDGAIELTMPAELAAQISADSQVKMPADLRIGMRIVDGMLYLNLADFKALAPELKQLRSDWVGFDLVGLMQQSMRQSQSAGSNLEGSAAAAAVSNAILQQMQKYIQIERLGDVKVGDEQAAVFAFRPDLVKFVGSQDFRDMMQNLAASLPSEGGSVSPAEMTQAVQMISLMAPLLFRDLSIEAQSTVGLKDFYALGSNFRFQWDLGSLLQLAAMSDNNLAQSLKSGQKPVVDLGYQATFSDHNAVKPIKAPADATIIPLNQMTPGDTSAVF